MSKKISVKLDGRSIASAIRELEKYEQKLNEHSQELVNALAEQGIKTASASGGTYAQYNTFYSHSETGGESARATFVGSGTEITKEWGDNGVRKSATINSLLMDEFGSGAMAEVLFDSANGIGGRGTLNTYGNAFRDEWYWDDDGFRTYSSGEIPSHPMHNASMEMQQSVEKYAKDIFGS